MRKLTYELLSNGTGVVSLKTWEECRVGGKIIIDEICREISSTDLFCADLTGLNHNVMFELGYAIARNKRIWLLVDQSVVETKADLAKLKMLTTIGYSNYSNSDNICANLLSEQPWNDLDNTIFNQSIRPTLADTHKDTLLYLKSRHVTEASTLISKEVEKAAHAMGIPLMMDDPRETTSQPLSWYGEQAYAAKCAVVHLINSNREGAHIHNAKYAFISGLALGLDKPVLMLVQGDFLAPLDYRDKLKHYQTGSEAERHLHRWLVPIMEHKKTETQSQQLYLSSLKLAQKLAELKIGEPIAENEADRLVNEYFIETTAYREAFEGRQGIFVGRKGAGKSANFLKLAAALEADKRNLVCVIKPPSYEMHGIVELLKKYSNLTQKNYAVESIWKFLIYSELAISVEEMISNRLSGEIYDFEKDLIALLDQGSETLRKDFSIRLERCVKDLLNISNTDTEDSIEKNRGIIAEAMHAGLLRRLREALVSALSGKQRIAILVDNLDKAWDKQGDIDLLTEFLLGLLSSVGRVAADFRGVGRGRLTMNVSLAVFVRADIFNRVMTIAREPDKIVYSKLSWNDTEMLIRVVDERFATSLGAPPSEVWSKYFCSRVRNTPVKEYILGRILKRPRDLLFFIKAAITTAVNRRHSMVEEKDILDAERQYSQFAIDSILVENGITMQQLEKVIYEFIGNPSILEEERIHELLRAAGIDEGKIGYVINHLCNLTFLGVEVNPGEFRFADDHADASRNMVLAQRLSSSRNAPRRYRINEAFWSFLEVSS